MNKFIKKKYKWKPIPDSLTLNNHFIEYLQKAWIGQHSITKQTIQNDHPKSGVAIWQWETTMKNIRRWSTNKENDNGTAIRPWGKGYEGCFRHIRIQRFLGFRVQAVSGISVWEPLLWPSLSRSTRNVDTRCQEGNETVSFSTHVTRDPIKMWIQGFGKVGSR